MTNTFFFLSSRGWRFEVFSQTRVDIFLLKWRILWYAGENWVKYYNVSSRLGLLYELWEVHILEDYSWQLTQVVTLHKVHTSFCFLCLVKLQVKSFHKPSSNAEFFQIPFALTQLWESREFYALWSLLLPNYFTGSLESNSAVCEFILSS